jgi:triacylglycerol lipase
VKSGLSLTDISVFNNDGVQAFAGYDETTEPAIILSFRGSRTTENWIQDLDGFLTDYPYCDKCKVHVGMWTTYLSVIEWVRPTVRALLAKYPRAMLQIFGHSLGGGAAVHAAADLYENCGIMPQWIYTFGQPRVGEKHFSTWSSFFYVLSPYYL